MTTSSIPSSLGDLAAILDQNDLELSWDALARPHKDAIGYYTFTWDTC